MVQSTVWQRDRKVGTKGRRKRLHRGYASACADRHKMVPRVHIRPGRGALCTRPPEIWREQKQCAVSEHGRGVSGQRERMRRFEKTDL